MQKDSPIVSVVMAIYNEPLEWLNESINSILKQSFKEFEFIIINDNPTRFLNKQVLIGFQSNDSRIVIINNIVNYGLTKSLNIGFKAARGKYIARMDADDISLVNRLQIQYDILEKYPFIGVVGSQLRVISDNFIRRRRKLPHSNEEISATLFFGNCIVHPSVMLRKSLFANTDLIYNENFRKAQDYELWARLNGVVYFHNIKSALILYRIHNQQITNKSKDEQCDFAFRVCLSQLKLLNITPTESEMELHKMVFTSNYGNNKFSVEDIEGWLLKIKNKNESCKKFDSKAFNRNLVMKFLLACLKSKGGFYNLKFYFNSELSIFNYYNRYIKSSFCAYF